MAGVLEKFFQMAFVITVMLLFTNVLLATFSEPLTGESLQSAETAACLEDTPAETTENVVWGQDAAIAIPQTKKDDWTCVWSQFVDLVNGFQRIITDITGRINPTEDDDIAEQVGDAVVSLINIIQIIGAAYIPWALISAWTGGGSP